MYYHKERENHNMSQQANPQAQVQDGCFCSSGHLGGIPQFIEVLCHRGATDDQHLLGPTA